MQSLMYLYREVFRNTNHNFILQIHFLYLCPIQISFGEIVESKNSHKYNIYYKKLLLTTLTNSDDVCEFV